MLEGGDKKMKIEQYSPSSGRIIAENGDVFNVTDCGSQSIVTTDSIHRYIHKGITFAAEISISDLAAGSVVEYSFKTPANEYVHLKNMYTMSFGANIRISIIKEASVSTEGTTPVPIHNMNHNSSNVSQVALNQGPTYTGGTVWKTFVTPGITTNQSANGSDFTQGNGEEIVLKNNNEIYIIKIENISSTDTASLIEMHLMWSEEQYGVI